MTTCCFDCPFIESRRRQQESEEPSTKPRRQATLEPSTKPTGQATEETSTKPSKDRSSPPRPAIADQNAVSSGERDGDLVILTVAADVVLASAEIAATESNDNKTNGSGTAQGCCCGGGGSGGDCGCACGGGCGGGCGG